MHVHVFTIDVMPIGNLTSSGGGLRSLQIVRGLQRRGVDVTYSIPTATDDVKAQWDQLSPEEHENAFSDGPGRTHFDIINRLRPDAAIYMWPHAFIYPRSNKADVVNVLDLNGLQNIERILAFAALTGTGRPSLINATQEYVRKFGNGDILLVGSEPQRAYWAGLNSYVNESLAGLEAITLPYLPPDLPPEKEYQDGEPTFYCAGSFLPWNSPEGHLQILASRIERAGRGKMLILGRANPLLSHANRLNAELRRLSQFSFVDLVSRMSYAEFSRRIAGNGIGIDLNIRTFEREFAFPIRMVTFLSHSVPVITNNYSFLSRSVNRSDAGWCIDPSSLEAFTEVVDKILHEGSASQIANKSRNARALAVREFLADDGLDQLVSSLRERVSNRTRKISSAPARKPNERTLSRLPVVLVVTEDHENFLQLRIRTPFDALYRNNIIAGYIVLQAQQVIMSVGHPADLTHIDVVWAQRGPTSCTDFLIEMFDNKYIYDIDDNLLISPSYRRPFSPEWCDMIIALLKSAACITTTTPRLVSSLQRHSGVQIEHKVVIAPNMTDYVFPRQHTAPPAGVLLASSDILPLTASKNSFFSAINRFCAARDLPVLYMGTSSNMLSELKGSVTTSGFLGYEEYRGLLRRRNLIAVAPLESHADAMTQDFINCKSDIKMVEFGAAGVPAVYAKAAPYIDSPLEVGPLVDFGDEKALIDALDEVYDNAAQVSRNAAESVTQHRLADNIAVSHWALALERCRLSVPVALSTIFEVMASITNRFRRVSSHVKPEDFNAEDYLAMNPDVAELVEAGVTTPFKHFTTVGAKEGRLWFPGGLKDEAAIMARYRGFVLGEGSRIDGQEQRIRHLEQRLTTRKENRSW